MKKEYKNYTADQLLQDDFFIQSLRNPTEETDLFWHSQLEEGNMDKEEYAIAQSLLHSMYISKNRLSPDELSTVWDKIKETNSHAPRKIFRLNNLLWVASVAALVVIGTFLLQTKTKTNDRSLRELAHAIKPQTEVTDIQLVLSDNEQILINEENAEIQYDKRGEIRVNEQKVKQKEEENPSVQKANSSRKINQLIVAKGKRSTLTFSDGTVLWVNAGSRIVYPEEFDKDYREIYVDGEAFLQVSPDSNRPFIVKTKQLDIRVLGTSFNVMAYEEDQEQKVSLLEGKVEISSEQKALIKLSANEIFRYENGSMSTGKANVAEEISWIDGMYIYHSEPLAAILERLSRYYGVAIEYSPSVSHLKCSGKLDLKNDFEKVLIVLAETLPITYEKNAGRYKIRYMNP